ncbi:MAG: hypothetical protein KJ622_10770 [Alphaproteobacteria bacterium]|nr:hypothetical protein [Alphaproteobacteria bacterium]
MMLLLLVQCALFAPHTAAAQPAEKSAKQAAIGRKTQNIPPRVAIADLPIPVQEMRDAILLATTSGRIEDLRTAIDWNELPPEFGFDAGLDPIEQFRKLSKDGEGREFLAILANLLAEAPALLPVGPDHENNRVFVWPYLSEIPPPELTAAHKVDLLRLMPVAEAEAVMTSDKWTWYRLAIAADGTWHIFSK